MNPTGPTLLSSLLFIQLDQSNQIDINDIQGGKGNDDPGRCSLGQRI